VAPQTIELFADADPRAIDDFRDVLAPHGAWVDDDALGTVWIPSDVALGESVVPFTPYASAGRWTHDGTEPVWVSDYPWGWVTFHYGRWAYSARSRHAAGSGHERAGADGWAWVPGRRYAGAWVDWRADEQGRWIGWAPTPPSLAWRQGDAHRLPPAGSAPYVYCAREDFFAEPLATRLVAMPDLLQVAAESRVALVAPVDGAGPRPPSGDPGLQRAWMLARPSTSAAFGVRPRLANASSRLRTFVAGAPRYVAR